MNMMAEEGDEWTSPVLGTCQYMCPIKEVDLRYENNLLHYLEVTDESKSKPVGKREPDMSRMVKEFQRPAAGKVLLDPDMLRPADVLLKTCHYLMSCATAPNTGLSWSNIYGFVFDRLRAVRQDMVIQRISGPPAIQILEMAVKFHVYSGYRLCEEKDVSKFDAHINSTHAIECMKRLMVMYESCESPGADKNRSFYTALYLLYNISSEEALLYCLRRIDLFRESADMKRALAISYAHSHRNYVRFLRLMYSSESLVQCALHRHLIKIYLETISIMASAYSSKNLHFDTNDLTCILKLNSKGQTENLCQLTGQQWSEKGVSFSKATLVTPQNMNVFHHRLHWIDEKLNVNDLVNSEIQGVPKEIAPCNLRNSNMTPVSMKGVDNCGLKPRSRGRGRGRGCAILKPISQ